jgi:glycosyltransferase involved in cell wall biosynthesis
MKPMISVYVLAFNEEEKIADCINSATWADEIVVIDSHSTDKTAEIAKNLGAKVVQVNFEGFGKIRMSGIEHTKYPWILSIDADERFTDEARNEVEQIINSKDSNDAYFIPRRNVFLGKKIKFCGWYPNYRQPQLFRRGKMVYETKDLVHEDFEVHGSIGYLINSINQIPFLNISEIFQKMDRYSQLGAEKLHAKGKKAPHGLVVLLRSIWTFFRIYILRAGILDGWAGFIIAFCNMEGTFYRYAKLKEIHRLSKDIEA